MATITSANAAYAIAIANLYPVPQTLQGYAADDMFVTEAVELAETIMGADGKLSAGYIFNPIKQTITIMPDSASLKLFEQWRQAQNTARDVYRCNAVIQLPGISRKYTLSNGVLSSATPIPGARKTLAPVSFTITWEKVIGEDM